MFQYPVQSTSAAREDRHILASALRLALPLAVGAVMFASAGSAQAADCAPAWAASQVYTGGNQASENGINYQANWWTQGEDPATHNGGAGSGQSWTNIGACTAGGGGGGGGGGTPPPSGSTRFAPYADISLGVGSQVAANAKAAGLKAITLAFLVDGGCTATWGGGLGPVSNAKFPNGTTVKSAIDALVAQGTSVIISWGGAAGSVQSSCGSAAQVQAMYQSVFDAYPNISGQDFDIEGGINNTVVGQALAGLKRANPSKSISLTLPVLPTGLVAAGLNIVNACHAAGFHPDTVNVLGMDYGSANDNGGNMLLSAMQAAQATRNQTGDTIGVTVMIGVNDTNTEIFTLAQAPQLVSWAKGQSFINRLSIWSLTRDNGSCAGAGFASPVCSAIAQDTWQFSSLFSAF